jgi:hypothetical protein
VSAVIVFATVAALLAVQASKVIFLVLVGICGIAFGTWLRMYLEGRKKKK